MDTAWIHRQFLSMITVDNGYIFYIFLLDNAVNEWLFPPTC